MSTNNLKFYEVSNPLIKNYYCYVNISDLHSNLIALSKLEPVLEELKPNFIVMSGDVIDSIDNKYNQALLKELHEISKKYRIYISYGNHDSVILSQDKHKMTGDYRLINSLAWNNIIVLGNKGSINYAPDLRIHAFDIPTQEWYYSNVQRIENINYFKNTYQPSPNQFNILLCHKPGNFIDENKQILFRDKLSNTLVNSGHNHGGFVLPFWQDKLRNTKLYGTGLVGPYNTLIYKNAYGYYTSESSSIIISDGITKWSDCNNHTFGEIFNSTFIPSIDVIQLKPGPQHQLIYQGYKNI